QPVAYQLLGGAAGARLCPANRTQCLRLGPITGLRYTAGPPPIWREAQPSMPRLLISCGEASADLYGAELVRHLRAERGPLEVFGLGGDHLAGQGAHLLAHI